MLTKNTRQQTAARGARFIIIASTYNARFVDSMVRAAKSEILRAGGSLKVVRVPGAYEIPAVAARLARAHPPAALICLGVILRGATSHAQLIGEAVSQALAHLQVEQELPIIHEVLLLESVQQARERCLSRTHNRGMEAAQTALKMAEIMRGLEED